jgi:hypothetical protein
MLLSVLQKCFLTYAETKDGAILFVFGDEAEAAAHQAEESSIAQEEHKAAEPEPTYEAAREATVKESAMATGAKAFSMPLMKCKKPPEASWSISFIQHDLWLVIARG